MPIPIPRSLEGVLQQLRQDVDSLLLRRPSSGSTPAGSVQMFAGATAPPGYAICDGGAVSRTDNPNLFAAVGVAYGAGDGSTTFNLPNLKGRVPVGQDAAQSEFNALGKAGGAKTHTLTEAQMPVHSHPQYVTANSGSEAIRRDYASDGGSARFPQGANTGNAGGGQAHNNLQPYVVMSYIIRLG
nr:MAG TPA: Baseplate wedge protein [Caudoviricetes sp.]